MNVTRNVIIDLMPLYIEKECSGDTRALVDEFLHSHPREAEELRQLESAPLPRPVPSTKDLDEVRSLQAARRIVRRRSFVLAFAIFFSLAPFSFVSTGDHTYWLLLQAPKTALAYAALAITTWVTYAIMRTRSKAF